MAVTIEALGLDGHERVLEVGTGSGYSAALLSRLGKQVFTVERLESLAAAARARLAELGYRNVEVLTGDGTLGWPEHAPYDGIAVAAGGPGIPEALKQQLAIGGRLIIPVGADESSQVLMRVTRVGAADFREEPLADVRFVPLIGEQGWPEEERILRVPGKVSQNGAVAKLIRETGEPMQDFDSSVVDALVERVGNAQVVLLGEATHGTSEFYRMRARITKELIERHGFDFVAVEADWPDAARVDDYVLGDRPRSDAAIAPPLHAFPRWMWRNEEVHEFIAWLRARNLARDRNDRVGFHGLDLYSMFTSIAAVLAYLDDVDPDAAQVARARYGALTPWQKDPAAYGRAVLVGAYKSSETAVITMLRDMLARRLEYASKDGERFFDAAQNARVVANAERYYRAMYYGAATLVEPAGRAHVRYARAPARLLRAAFSWRRLGAQLPRRQRGGDRDEHARRAQRRTAVPARSTRTGPTSWDLGPITAPWRRRPAGMSPCRDDGAARPPRKLRAHLSSVGAPGVRATASRPETPGSAGRALAPRLERAIGVVYRPDTELASHYFYATLPHQFDELVWFDETRALEPLPVDQPQMQDLPETYPFGL